VRVASGQKIPELGINVEDEGSGAEGAVANDDGKTGETASDAAIEVDAASPQSAADVDIADRAAAMLEGLQGGAALNKDGSLSVRRRRESADTERQRRRNRRQQASSKADGDEGLMSPREEDEVEGEGMEVVISPPSPERQTQDDREEGGLATPPPEDKVE
jgi:cytokinesis protein